MNKGDLITKVAEKTDLTKKDCEKVVNETFEAIKETLADGEKVQLIGFGTFETRKRQAREGRNPATGDVIQIPEATVPAFKPGKQLKETVTE